MPTRPGDPDAAPLGRVCVVLLTGLGDVVHGLPLVTALKRAGVTRHVTWVAEPMPAQLLRGHPAIDRVVEFRRRDGWRGVVDLRRDLGAARRAIGGFDVALNLNVYFKAAWPLVFSGAPVRWGFGRERAKDGVWLAANRHLPPGPRRHTQDMFLEFLTALRTPHHAPATPADWRLNEFTVVERAAQATWASARDGRPRAAIVPASAVGAKDWPAERWAAVADALERRWGFEVVLVGGPGGRETEVARAITAGIEALGGPAPTWAMGDGVRRVAWTIGACDLVLAPDTGPLHIARAIGVPVVGLFGHTNPWRVGPYRADEDLWVDAYTPPGSAPDPSAFDPPPDDRMLAITVDDVLARVGRAVATRLGPARASATGGGATRAGGAGAARGLTG